MADKNIVFGVGARIKEIRENKHLTQEELASRTDGTINKSRICSYERGIRMPDLWSLSQIAQALDTTLDYLFYGEGRTKVNYRIQSKQEQTIDHLARLLDLEVIHILDDEIFLCDYHEKLYLEFIKDYTRILSKYDKKQREYRLRNIETYYKERMKMILNDFEEETGMPIESSLYNINRFLLKMTYEPKKK